jgi:hypothetical protein
VIKKLGRTSLVPVRFSQLEKLPLPKRKQIVQILDSFLGSEKVSKNRSTADNLIWHSLLIPPDEICDLLPP